MQGKLPLLPPRLGYCWEGLVPRGLQFQEAAPPPPVPERLLQLVWHHQRLLPHQLVTTEGESVVVLHPGFWNRGSGPDFSAAVIKIGAHPLRTGDVEIDLIPEAWRAHGHYKNPEYANVILHVVWKVSGTLSPLPTLSLEHVLDAPLEELRRWMAADPGTDLPPLFRGQCSGPLARLSEALLTSVLDHAALIRLDRKGMQLTARAQQVGWEQSLWEALLAALGYRQNTWPMRRLAERLPLILEKKGTSGRPDRAQLEARLFGVSNLLPAELGSRPAPYLRTLWDLWWREREIFHETILPKEIWRFSGVRPANHPHRRLALAADWLARPDFVEKLEAWATRELGAAEAGAALLEILSPEPDAFWSSHWNLLSRRVPGTHPLLGLQRVTDLAVNALLPWLWGRARFSVDEKLCRTIECRYLSWPAGQDNSVLRLARERLLKSSSPKLFTTAARQQGLFQILHDFCDQSNALCDECEFPSLIAQLHQNS